jgi:phenylpropionate dioxygenase-like ring-hydroxylating dioxygenase large terminal subunit
MPFLENAWYCAAWSADLTNKPQPIKIIGTELVIYRKSDGAPVAMFGLCPHRFAPLELGRVDGDHLVCGYHGLRFDPTGTCTLNPHGRGIVPPRARLRTFPIEERHGAVWVWMGDPALADPEKIIAFDFLSNREKWTGFTGYLHISAGYQLVLDNLLDLTHATYLHPTTVGVSEAARRGRKTEHSFSVEDGVIISSYFIQDSPPTPLFKVWTARERGDIYSPISLHLPSNLILELTMTDHGALKETGSHMPSAHFIVPETETSCHYFYAMGRNERLNDDSISQAMAEILRRAFVDEDEPMVRAVQQAMGDRDFFELAPAILESDVAAISARRALAKLIREEKDAANSKDHGPPHG